MGDGFGCALGESNGCWGNSTKVGEFIPPPNAVQLAAGEDVICALTEIGTVQCNEPDLDLTEAGDLKQIAVSDRHACGLDSDGTVQCWGDSEMLGPPPVDVEFAAIDVNWLFACGLTKNGHARCWGTDGWNGTMEITTWEIE